MNKLQRQLTFLLPALLFLLLVGGWVPLFVLSSQLQPRKKKGKPVPGYALLRITPADARLKVDGKPVKKGANGLSLAVGRHTFTASAPGYLPQTRVVVIHSDDAALVRLRLKPLPVVLQIDSIPSGAQLFLSGKPSGKTPFRQKIVPGWYQIRLQKKGFVKVVENVQIRARQENIVRLRLGGSSRVRSKDNMRQRWVPGGYFPRGSDDKHTRHAQKLCQKHSKRKQCPSLWFSFERPRRLIRLSSYWIDEFEVTRKQYQKCVDAKVCPASLYQRKNPKYPVNGISWTAAKTYCEWVGGRLPTEAEWELAARGQKGLRYPWGMKWEPSFSNHGLFRFGSSLPDNSDGYRQEAPVGSFSKGRSPYRVQDMAGNLHEWVQDCFHGTFYVRSNETNPLFYEKNCFSHVIRGGSWMSPVWELRTTHRASMPTNSRATHVGFRCAQDPSD